VRHHDGPPELLGRHLWWSHQQRFVFFVHRVVMGSFWVSCHFRDFGCFFFLIRFYPSSWVIHIIYFSDG
jgi:hypothetical protein